MMALRIMGGADCVKSQFIFQQLHIVFLHAFRHGIANIWIALMTVNAADLVLFSVEIESVIFEYSFPETDAILPGIHHFAVLHQFGFQNIECGGFG